MKLRGLESMKLRSPLLIAGGYLMLSSNSISAQLEPTPTVGRFLQFQAGAKQYSPEVADLIRITAPGVSQIPQVAGALESLEAKAMHSLSKPTKKGRRIAIGATIGAVSGLLACTTIATIADELDRISTCTWKGNLALGLTGAAGGAAIAWITGR